MTSVLCGGALIGGAKTHSKHRLVETSPVPQVISEEFVLLLGHGGAGQKRGLAKPHLQFQLQTLGGPHPMCSFHVVVVGAVSGASCVDIVLTHAKTNLQQM